MPVLHPYITVPRWKPSWNSLKIKISSNRSRARHYGYHHLSLSTSRMVTYDCVSDMCKPNEALRPTHHLYPTSEEILQDQNGSNLFSKIDLKEWYHQIELAESSRHLTTFRTHVGLRRYKRLPYRASVCSEICQHVIGQVFEGCHNVRNIAEDILVHGTTKEEHDRPLENVLLRLQEKNLTVNQTNCLFDVPELDY